MELGEEEDIRLLVEAEREDDEDSYGSYETGEFVTVDWNEIVEDEDPAILWTLKNGKFAIFDILPSAAKLKMMGNPSADLTIICGSDIFRVHKGLLSHRSPVFSAMLNCDMREAREGEINIRNMNSNTLSSMIHYIYTGELADGWQDLDIQDVTIAADMYDLPGWMELFTSQDSSPVTLQS